MELLVEPLVEKYLTAAAHVLVEAYRRPPWNEDWTIEAAAEAVTDAIAAPRSIALVAVDSGMVVGVVYGVAQRRDIGRVFYLDELSVLPDMQRKGVGRALMQALRAVAHSRGCTRVWLVTQNEGTASDFYRRCGFSQSVRLSVFSTSLE